MKKIMTRFVSYSVLLLLFLILGCSSTKSSPVVPENPQADINLPATELNTDESSHSLLGTWTLSINHETLEATVTPNRSLNQHYEVKHLIPIPEVVINTIYPNYVIDADVTITNPYAYPAYDIGLIIFTDEYGHFLDNADAWTDLYDIPAGEDINPFKAYAKDQPNRIFEGETSHTENLLVFDPPPGHPIQFAIDASYPGNCEEPYEIINFSHTTLYERGPLHAVAQVDVLDWQDNVSEVYLECPEITGQPQISFNNTGGNMWSLDLFNQTGTNQGEYKGWIIAISEDAPSIALYKRIIITVTPGCINPHPTVVGEMHFINNCHDIEISGNRAFLADGGAGFKTLDISDPMKLNITGCSNISNKEERLIIRDNYAYTAGDGSVCIYDISDPDSPEFVDSHSLGVGKNGRDIELYGQNLLALAGNLCIMEISDNINYHVEYDLGGGTNIAVTGDYLYHSRGDELRIYDLSDIPHWLPLLEQYSLDCQVDIIIDGEVAYFMGYDNFWLMDISDPLNPVEIGHLEGDFLSCKRVLKFDDLIYVLESRDLIIINIEDLSNPVILSQTRIADPYLKDFAFTDNKLCITSYVNGLMFVDVLDPNNPVVISEFSHFGVSSSVTVNSDYAYITNKQPTPYTGTANEICVYDVHDPYSPEKIYEIPGTRNCNEIIIRDSLAYVAGGYEYHDSQTQEYNGYLIILDINNASQPVSQGIARTLSGIGMDVAVSGNFATVGTSGDGFANFHIANPEIPYFLGSIKPPNKANGVVVKNYHSFFAGTDGLNVIDNSNPYEPIQVGGYSGGLGEGIDVLIKDDFAYVSHGGSNIYILDVSVPASPEYIAIIDEQGFSFGNSKMCIAYDYLFYTDGYELRISDISDPYNVKFISALEFDCKITDVAVKDRFAYLTKGQYGFSIIELWQV